MVGVLVYKLALHAATASMLDISKAWLLQLVLLQKVRKQQAHLALHAPPSCTACNRPNIVLGLCLCVLIP